MTDKTAISAVKGSLPRVSDRVAQRILGMIAAGDLVPGQRLPGERQLAERMGVSRVSVRAALQSLKTQGFLTAVQGGGTRVISSANTMDAPLATLVRANLENLTDLAEIRAILEVWAARRAAGNATPEDLLEMERALLAMEQDTDRGLRHKPEDDVDFHLSIAKASGSAVYMHIVSMIRDVLAEMVDYHRHELFPEAEKDLEILAHHRRIFDAIRTGDGEGAALAMHAHLNWVNNHYHVVRLRRAAQLPVPA